MSPFIAIFTPELEVMNVLIIESVALRNGQSIQNSVEGSTFIHKRMKDTAHMTRWLIRKEYVTHRVIQGQVAQWMTKMWQVIFMGECTRVAMTNAMIPNRSKGEMSSETLHGVMFRWAVLWWLLLEWHGQNWFWLLCHFVVVLLSRRLFGSGTVWTDTGAGERWQQRL